MYREEIRYNGITLTPSWSSSQALLLCSRKYRCKHWKKCYDNYEDSGRTLCDERGNAGWKN